MTSGNGSVEHSDRIKKYIQVNKTKSGVQILVRKIGWDGPTEMISKWEVENYFKIGVSETEIEQAVERIIKNGRFFRLCSDCGEYKPVGLMWENYICQGCAAANHGIIF